MRHSSHSQHRVSDSASVHAMRAVHTTGASAAQANRAQPRLASCVFGARPASLTPDLSPHAHAPFASGLSTRARVQMGEAANVHILRPELTALSSPAAQAAGWAAVCSEWEMTHIDEIPGGTCLCTHYPITQRYAIRNTVTGETTVIGNVCEREVLRENHMSAFAALKRITAEPGEKTANLRLLALLPPGTFTVAERDSYRALLGPRGGVRRNLTAEERRTRLRLNRRIVAVMRARREAEAAVAAATATAGAGAGGAAGA